MFFAFFISVILVVLAVFSIRRQYARLIKMSKEPHIPSDDRRYLTRQAYRRIIVGILLVGLAGMLAGTYFFDQEKRAEQLGDHKRELDENGNKLPLPKDDRDFLRFYSFYWMTVLILLFVIISLAMLDIWATRRYAWQQFRRIQAEHRTVLERDLALYRQQKINNRMRGAQS